MTRDFFELFKLNILKNGALYLALILWFVIFTFAPLILVNYLPLPAISIVAELQEILHRENYLVVPLEVVRFVFWVIAFLLFKELYDRFRIYIKIKLSNSYKFTPESWNNDWIFNGRSYLLQNPLRLRINSSRAGCVCKKYLWKNLDMNFQMQFFKEKPFRYNYDKKLGIIFRAVDLDNYFMLQISCHSEANKTMLTAIPHVRYRGMWEIMSDEAIGTINTDNVPDWLDVKLILRDRKVLLEIEGVGSFTWMLPTHIDINHIEDGIRKSDNNLPKDNSGENFGAKVQTLPEIDFRNSFGLIGFRAYLNEGADIKNLSVDGGRKN